MATPLRNLNRTSLCLAAFLVCGVVPAQAAWIGYMNDTKVVIVVHGSSPVGVGQPHQINANQAAWDQVKPGNKTVTITDPQTNKLLWKGPVTVGDKDLFYSIQVGKDGTYRMVPAPVPAGMMPRKK